MLVGIYLPHNIIKPLRCVQLGLQMAASPPRVEMRIIGLAETEDGAASYKLRLMLSNPAAALLIPATDQRHLLQVASWMLIVDIMHTEPGGRNWQVAFPVESPELQTQYEHHFPAEAVAALAVTSCCLKILLPRRALLSRCYLFNANAERQP